MRVARLPLSRLQLPTPTTEPPGIGGTPVVVHLDRDFSGPTIRHRVLAALEGPASDVVLDMRQIDQLSNVGVALLIGTRARLRARKSQLTLVCTPHSATEQALSRAGLLGRFTIERDLPRGEVAAPITRMSRQARQNRIGKRQDAPATGNVSTFADSKGERSRPVLAQNRFRTHARLSLLPAERGRSTFLDGAWWPRSHDLAHELPALLAALEQRGVRVQRVSYAEPPWTAVPRRITVAGRIVHLDRHESTRPAVISLGTRYQDRALELLVVPPSTDPHLASRLMTLAAQPGNRDAGAALLAADSTRELARRAGLAWERSRHPRSTERTSRRGKPTAEG